MEESSGGSQLGMMYEEKQAEVQAEMEQLQQKAEAQQGANATCAIPVGRNILSRQGNFYTCKGF